MSKAKVVLIKGSSGQEYLGSSKISIGETEVSIRHSVEPWLGVEQYIKSMGQYEVKEVEVIRAEDIKKAS